MNSLNRGKKVTQTEIVDTYSKSFSDGVRRKETTNYHTKGRKAAVRLYCSCGWQEMVAVDESLSHEEAWKSCNKIQEEHMKTHNPNFNLDDYKPRHIGHSKKLIN